MTILHFLSPITSLSCDWLRNDQSEPGGRQRDDALEET